MREVILGWFTFIADFTWMDVNMNHRNDHMDDVWIIKRPAQYKNLKKSSHMVIWTVSTYNFTISYKSPYRQLDIYKISKFKVAWD